MKLASLSVRFGIVTSLLAISLAGGTPFMVLSLRSFLQHEPGRPVVLAAAPASTRTFKEGSRLYLDNGTMKVGLETKWGGTIVEVVWHGMNFVNDFDPGRDIQVAFYDGNPYSPCDDCAGANGWNPVQGGDHYKNGSPVVEQTLGQDSIYIKTLPYHWVPENKGGSKEQPAPGDVFVEQWVSFLPAIPFGVKVHYKITHFGKDQHTYTFQEFPAVYVDWKFSRFVYYGGEAPWTNAPVSFSTMPDLPKSSPQMYAPELWGGFINNDDIGLVVFVPGQYPYVGGFSRPPTTPNSGAHYFSPHVPFSFGPNSVLEDDVYLFAGDYRQARQAIYSLHASLPERNSAPPYGVVDAPKWKARCTGPLNVGGWAIAESRITEINVLVDGHLAGAANYGVPRPDVSKIWPHAPIESGFNYKLDTTKYPNGEHILEISVRDAPGHVVVLSKIRIVIDNPAVAAKPR